jgi:hypothetical protein
MSARAFAVNVVNVCGCERTIEQAIDTDKTIFVSTSLINVGQTLGVLDKLDQVKGVIVLAHTAA